MSKKSAKEKSKLFSRGYGAVREKLSKRQRGVMSCKNCQWLSQTKEEQYETCKNNNVTEWDMVHTEHGDYCPYWEPMDSKADKILEVLGDKVDRNLAHNLALIGRSFSPAQKARMNNLGGK